MRPAKELPLPAATPRAAPHRPPLDQVKVGDGTGGTATVDEYVGLVAVGEGRREHVLRQRQLNPGKVRVGYYITCQAPRGGRQHISALLRPLRFTVSGCSLAHGAHRSIRAEMEALVEEWDMRAGNIVVEEGWHSRMRVGNTCSLASWEGQGKGR